MAKTSTYRLDSYGPPGEAAAPRGGVFQLSDDSWRLAFAPPGAGVDCGLLCSSVEVAETRRRRRCRVTVTEDGPGGFRSTFVLRARAEAVRNDLSSRFESLDRAAEVIAAVQSGEWWRGSDAFDALGWSKTTSIAGVRCIGGSWGATRIKRTHRARVLDFGRDGVSLRSWRTRLVLPWVSIAAIEVTDAQGYTRGPKHRRTPGGAVIVLTCHSGEQVAFHAVLLTPSETSAELRVPIGNTLDPPGKVPQLPSPGSMAIGPAPAPASPRSTAVGPAPAPASPRSTAAEPAPVPVPELPLEEYSERRRSAV